MACQPFPLTLYPPSCISFPAPSHCLCPYYWTLLFYYWVLASNWVFFYYAGAFVIFLDSTWWYVPFFHNYSTLVLVCWLVLCILFICPRAGNFWKGLNGRCIWNPYCTFSSNFSATVMTLFRDASVIAYACAFTNPFSRGFRPYIKACMALSVAKSGNATTTLSN